MPPQWRNHRVPTGGDTPATRAASSLASPRAMATQTGRRAAGGSTGGRPGDRSFLRVELLDFRRPALVMPHLVEEVLRRPIEFTEYLAHPFRVYLQAHGIRQSASTAGPGDNAHMESFFHSLKAEVIRGCHFATEHEVRAVLRSYIRYYNETRAHSALGYRSPIAFERQAA